MCLEINRKLFSSFLSKCRTHLKYFSGTSTKDLEYYATPTLIEEKPDIVVICIDSNDTDFQQLRHNTVENIGKYINNGQKCRESGVSNVIISSVLVKLTKFIRQLNDILHVS